MPRTVISHKLVTVSSTSRFGIEHDIFIDGVLRCTCEDSTIRTRDCRHVREYLRGIRDGGERSRQIEKLDRLERKAANLRRRLGL